MGVDFAINYNAKLIEIEDNIQQLKNLEMEANHFKKVENNIQQLKSLEIEVNNFQKEVEYIKQETEQEINIKYSQFKNTDFFLNDALIGVYKKAIEKLESLNDRIISVYEYCYIIQAKSNELSRKCESLNKIGIEVIVKDTCELLEYTKQSTPADYNNKIVKEQIVENVYNLVYHVIKLELVYTNKSTLLEQMRASTIDISYLTKVIKEDIQNLSDSQKSELSSKLQEIDKKGFNDIYYLDKDLILLISVLQNKDLLEKVEESFLTKVNESNSTLDKLKESEFNYQDTQNRIKELQKKIKKLTGKKFRKRLLLYFNMGLVGAAMWGSIKLCRDITKEKQYKTITVMYDTSSLEEETIVEYLPSKNDSVELIEYSPWDEPGYFRDGYKRNVYTYILDNVNESYENPKDYLTPDIKDFVRYLETVETKTEKPDDQYIGNKYVVTTTTQDKEDFYEKDNKFNWMLLNGVFTAIIVGLDALIFSKFSKTRLGDLKEEKIYSKEQLEHQKQLLLETHTQISELTEAIENQKIEVEKSYQELPQTIQQSDAIKKCFKDKIR